VDEEKAREGYWFTVADMWLLLQMQRTRQRRCQLAK